MFKSLQHSVEYVGVTCPLGKSDHCFLYSDFNWDYVSNEIRLTLHYSGTNFSAIEDFVNNTELPSSSTTERSFSNLHRLPCTVDTESIPRVRISREELLSLLPCIRRLVNTRNKLFAIMKTDPSHVNSSTYHQIRNKFWNMICIFLKEKQRRLLGNGQNNPLVISKYFRG